MSKLQLRNSQIKYSRKSATGSRLEAFVIVAATKMQKYFGKILSLAKVGVFEQLVKFNRPTTRGDKTCLQLSKNSSIYSGTSVTNGGENLMGQTVTNDEEKTNPAFLEKLNKNKTNNFWNKSKQTK